MTLEEAKELVRVVAYDHGMELDPVHLDAVARSALSAYEALLSENPNPTVVELAKAGLAAGSRFRERTSEN